MKFRPAGPAERGLEYVEGLFSRTAVDSQFLAAGDRRFGNSSYPHCRRIEKNAEGVPGQIGLG